MRALGPGSVSSLLKLVLDVISIVLWVIIALLFVGAFMALLLPAEGLADAIGRLGLGGDSPGPMVAAGLVAAALLMGMVQFIVNRLRRVFHTLTAGDPFHPDNVKRLRAIGFGLAALQVVSYFAGAVLDWAFREDIEGARLWPSLPAWLAVLAVFVLAEVFREGARLRGEAELTI